MEARDAILAGREIPKSHEQQLAEKDAEIAQLRGQLAAYEAEPIIGFEHKGYLVNSYWKATEPETYAHFQTPIIRKPTSTAHLDAIKQEARDKALEDATSACKKIASDYSVFGHAPYESMEEGALSCEAKIRAVKGGK